jgi:sugar phosphate isomerase/epimerase
VHSQNPSRREWLGAAALGLAAPLAAGNKIGRDRLSAVTDEIARTPAAAIDFAKTYSLKWVELRSVPGKRGEYFQLPEAELKQAAREFADNGLKVSFLNTSMCKYWLPGTTPANPRAQQRADRFEKRKDELRKSIEAAHILGVNKIRVFCFLRVAEPEPLFPRISEIVMELAEMAGRDKMTLLVENEGACNVGTATELAKFVKMSPFKWLGANWDPHNGVNRQEVAYPDGYEMLPPKRIGNVQVKGKSLLGPDILDWATIFKRLEKDGYKGQIGLETHIFGDIQIQKSHESIKELIRIVG